MKARNLAGKMVPLGAVMDLQDTTGPDRIQRYNLYLSAEINGASGPGYSSGQSLAAMEEIADKIMPAQYNYEWTELAYQEQSAGNTALLHFPSLYPVRLADAFGGI